ncbi:Gfo/Idh/MocA family oxidoreductase [Luteolibacter pohnpeiensis]|uniref:Gfo/Idh/MocA family oxidoreductase n=2 Tax=Luteolibacter pohnpeiensis TaxID=454153 RepID=A0A934S4Y4_9BACT|nr:Gfo/Idh/MocA family oxidoreductase [Luteolibacter pohnpeiensis]
MSLMENADTVRWGVLGPGRIARDVVRDLQMTPNAVLEVVCSRSLDRAEAFAQEFGFRRAMEGEEALAADPDVDIVYIASPHPAHFESAKRMLLAGKPVVCEKPMTMDAAQARELIAISKQQNVFLMEAVWTRCLPVFQVVRKWLQEERVGPGKPRLVSSSFCVGLSKDPKDRWLNPELGGGGLLDLGVYPLTVSQLAMGGGAPVEIKVMADFAETGVDEMVSGLMRYEHGGVARFTCSMRTEFECPLEIGGEDGFIRVPSRFLDANEATLTVGNHSETVRAPRRGQGYVHELEEAMRCLRSGEIESPMISHADTLATMETMDRIRAQIGLKYPGEE